MNTVRVRRFFKVTGASDLKAYLGAVMEELLNLEDDMISDPDVSASLANGAVEISITANDADFDTAVAKGQATIRTAIHAAGGHTPDWESVVYKVNKTEAELVSA